MQNSLHLVSENGRKAHFLLSSTKTDLETNKINIIIAKKLIECGCNLNHKDYQYQETPIFKAIIANNYDLCKLYIQEGIDLTIRNAFGNDALSRAIQLGRFRLARLITSTSLSFRSYSCIYKIPNLNEFERQLNSNDLMSDLYDLAEYGHLANNQVVISNNQHQFRSNESFLQYTLSKYEEYLKYLENHLRQPRTLVDLCRLNTRIYMKKPISNYLIDLNIPNHVKELILLRDVDF